MSILITDIKPNTWNPNQMTPEEFEELKKEISHLGKPPKPTILRKKDNFYEIVDGEHNYRALKELGFTELKDGWYEIHDYDDVEAMRQTYKRNLGGINNPIKLGLMFERAIKESGVSNRELAEKWDLSEGTIRNYLLYAEVSKLRNDYANLEKLSVKQIRIYKTLSENAKPVADLWLYYGADPDALNIWNDKSYEWVYNSNGEKLEEYQIFKDITISGFYKSWYIQKDVILFCNEFPDYRIRHKETFKRLIKDAIKKIDIKHKLEQSFTFGIIGEDTDGKKLAKEYIDLFFHHPLMLKSQTPKTFAPSLFAQVIKRNTEGKLEFLLTIEELKECLDNNKTKTYDEIISYARLLIAKKYNKAPSENKDAFTYTSIEEQLDTLEIEKNASENLKKLQLPIRIKKILYEAKISDEILPIVGERLVLNYRGGAFSIHDSDEVLKEKVTEQINYVNKKLQEQLEEQKLRNSTPEQLADLIVEQIKTAWKSPTEESINDFKNRLAKNFNRSELYVFSFIARKFYDAEQFKQRMMKMVEDIKNLRQRQI